MVQPRSSQAHRAADVPPDPDSATPLAMRSFGLTDPGKVRDHNEDQFLIASMAKALQVESTSLPQPAVQHSSDRGHLFIVADGMGGHAAGERASALAIGSVEGFVLQAFRWFTQLTGEGENEILRDFRRALTQANNQVLRGCAPSLAMARSLGH